MIQIARPTDPPEADRQVLPFPRQTYGQRIRVSIATWLCWMAVVILPAGWQVTMEEVE